MPTSGGPAGYFFAFPPAGGVDLTALAIAHPLMPMMPPRDDDLKHATA